MPKSKRPRKPYRDKFIGEYKPPDPKPTSKRPVPELTPEPEVPRPTVRPARLRGRTGILVGTGLAATGGAALLAHRRRSTVNKLYDPFADEMVEFGKADEKYSSGGRSFWSGYAPGVHGAIAGKKGKKVRAFGNEAIRSNVGAIPGRQLILHGAEHKNFGEVGAGAGLAAVGSATGGVLGNRANIRRGNLKPVGKAYKVGPTPMFGTNVQSVAPRTAEGPGVSHENKLLVIRRKARSKTPPQMIDRYHGNKSKSPNLSKSLQGASVKGERGTPMSSMAHNGRVGRRLRVV